MEPQRLQNESNSNRSLRRVSTTLLRLLSAICRLLFSFTLVFSYYGLLLLLDSVDSAHQFYQQFNQRAFSALKPADVCDVVFVQSVHFRDAPASPTAGGLSTSASVVLACDESSQSPTTSLCPICQDVLRKGGVMTTLCNHDFHSKCLSESPESVCAVCRFHCEPCNRTKCCVCSSDEDLWMCTQCGHTGCGRTKGSHAEMHFHENPGHNIASEIGTQRVWDYKADNWVFDPQCFPFAADGLHGCVSQEEADEAFARQVGGKSDVQMSLNSKLEAIGTEYNYMLVSLLDSQKQ